MINFLRRRLQVFVSSTFTDLTPERQAAVEAILTAGHIPAGMELFTSGDESQMDVIKQWIDESDVYLLILGGRYGSIEPTTKKSYTQLEYEYAVNANKPLFACVITDDEIERRTKEHGRSHLETKNPQELAEFRNLALSKMSKFWEDSKDIKLAVGETLSHFARRHDLVGWVRPDQEANTPALADEIARLSKENAQLRTQLADGQPEPLIHGLNFAEMKTMLESNNLLGILFQDRESLGTYGWVSVTSGHGKELEQLCVYGLVVLESDGRYRLTDQGRQFLNRFSFELTNSGTPKDN